MPWVRFKGQHLNPDRKIKLTDGTEWYPSQNYWFTTNKKELKTIWAVNAEFPEITRHIPITEIKQVFKLLVNKHYDPKTLQ